MKQISCLTTILLMSMLSPLFAQPAPTSTPMERETVRLTIVMGGAVSLGSFEGGIVAELCRQLQANNADPTAPYTYVVDCLVGASAGSMTLALLAHEMYTDGSEPFDPKESSFYKAWVQQIDIDSLLPGYREKLKEDPFVLSSGIVDRIAKKNLKDIVYPNPVNFAPDNLYMCMTLSNVNGLDYPIDYTSENTDINVYTDKRFIRLSHGGTWVDVMSSDLQHSCSNSKNWDVISSTAVASGAFPFAFKPRNLVRYKDEYHYQPKNNLNQGMLYVDGGFFNNDPIHTASEMVKLIDTGDVSLDQSLTRRFIYLAPTDTTKQTGTNYDTKAVDYTKQIIHMLFTTSTSNDYRNYVADVRDNRALIDEISQFVLYNCADADSATMQQMLRGANVLTGFSLRPRSPELLLNRERLLEYSRLVLSAQKSLELMAKAPLDLRSSVAECVDTSFTTTTQEDDRILERNKAIIAADEDQQRLFLALFALLDCERPNKYVLISDNKDLLSAGGKYAAFGGFMSEDIREYNFQLGRYWAQQSLKKNLGIEPRNPIARSDIKARQDTLFKAHNNFKTIRDHFPPTPEGDKKREMVRRHLERRIIGYTQHLELNYFLKLAISMSANPYLNKYVYYDRTPFTFDVTKSLQVGAGWKLGLRIYPADWLGGESHYYNNDKKQVWRPYLATDFGLLLFAPTTKYTYFEPSVGVDFLARKGFFHVVKFRFAAGDRILAEKYRLPGEPKHLFFNALGVKFLEAINFQFQYLYHPKGAALHLPNLEYHYGVSINLIRSCRFFRSLKQSKPPKAKKRE